jgi:hypothetical protein
MNCDTGRRARRRNALLDDFIRKFMFKLAILMSKGCAIRFPVMEEMLVLSDDKMVPRIVAPLGRQSYVGSIEGELGES